jgi:hypothetical protein
MPSATGSNWEKYQKNFADDEEPEKKITPLTERSVSLDLSDPDEHRIQLVMIGCG